MLWKKEINENECGGTEGLEEKIGIRTRQDDIMHFT